MCVEGESVSNVFGEKEKDSGPSRVVVVCHCVRNVRPSPKVPRQVSTFDRNGLSFRRNHSLLAKRQTSSHETEDTGVGTGEH